MTRLVSTIVTLVCIFVVTGCDRENIPPKKDPCVERKSFNGDFEILEHVGDSLVATDSALQYNSVTFRASDIYDLYEWKIGDDDRKFTSREVTLLFTEAIGRINVTLKSRKKIDPCFPDDPSQMTVTKTVDIIEWQYAPIIGKYVGSFGSTPNQKDTVEVKFTSTGYDEFGSFDLININRGCMLNPDGIFESVWDTNERGVQAFGFQSWSAFYYGCKAPDVWIKLIGRDSLDVSFTYKDNSNPQPPYPVVRDTFKGIRLIN